MTSWFSKDKPFSSNLEKSGTSWNKEIVFQDTTRKDTLKNDSLKNDSLKNDTIKKDTNQPYKPSKNSTFEPKDRFGDPFSEKTSPSPLLLGDPSSLKLDLDIDTAMDYTIYESIGDTRFRPTTSMTFEEFSKLQERQMLKNYWQNRAAGLDGESAVSGRSLIPPIYISPVFDRIFGGSLVDIRPSGFVTLDFGGRYQRIDNPSIPIRQQRNGSFEFDQQISMNVIGKVGEKMAITANFDNNNSFDFENDLRVEYTGFEEDIIKKIEIGNVSMPINNSLIMGAQNLFGIKTQLQFGRLFVTGVASTQRGKSDFIEVEGGAQGREFLIRGSEYDENRHFFLGQFFRNNYGVAPGQWLSQMPQITSGVNITRLEVYVLNRNNNTETLRNIVGLMDLGEGQRIFRSNNPKVGTGKGNVPTGNDANELFKNITSTPEIRNSDRVDNILEQPIDQGGFGFVKATDFEKVNQARRLNDREYTFNPELGYLTLTRKLQNDEVLAVSFEYTYNGKRYKVGELSEDYQNRPENEVVFLKLLRPSKINLRTPTWDLMMKNVYSLNATQITREGFQLRVIYRDDATGIDNPSLHEGRRTKDIPLIQLLGLDRLNQANDPQPDGNFDYVEGITINEEMGTIIFPVLQPFGTQLRRQFDEDEAGLINKYVYDTLYTSTKADAELVAVKNKFFIEGRFQAGSSSEIMLQGINIAEGSVRVFAGNTPLTEGTDYTVDYNFGKVSILNQGVLASGKKIRITYEKADLFNFQTRSLLGTRLDYMVGENFNIGATLLYLNERPLITRVNIGDEPVRNTTYGFDINYQKDSRFLTKMVDALPFLQTKEMSTINFSAEFAQLLPGTSNRVDGEGSSYIDDFESTATPYALTNNIQNWKLAATPKTNENRFNYSSDLSSTYQRARLAWYSIDNIFYRTGGGQAKPPISQEDAKNHYVRQVSPQEVFSQQDRQVVNTNISTFDLAYFPSERGQYNFNPDFTRGGLLSNPQLNFGGISRAITSEVDFDKNNIEYIEFWMMDPFINHSSGNLNNPNGLIDDGIHPPVANTTGGELFFNLGSISEDIMKDGRHAFENGLPPDYDPAKVVQTDWGRVPRQQYLPSGFDQSPGARANQDVGLDGLKSQDETVFFQNPDALPEELRNDPAGDDFAHFLGPQHDQRNAKIIERYKKFNGMEGNTPINNESNYVTQGSPHPDNEDLNGDNTISDLEEYYEYKINLRPEKMVVGQNYIVDEIITNENVTNETVKWYLFRVPVRQPDGKVGDIEGFKSIRFMRTYLTGFSQPVVLRLLKFQLVGSQWRTYNERLDNNGFGERQETYDPKFTVSVVNIEENSTGSESRPPYVLPPGIIRDRDNTSTIERRVNEQSLQLCVEDLRDKDSRAVFKNANMDFINYGRLKMFFHANGENTLDHEVSGFIRLGTDFTENYYEIEVPLKITRANETDPAAIWPKENEIDISFNELYALKAKRDRANRVNNLPYTDMAGHYKITVVGRPDLSTVQTLMIGVRNPESLDGSAKSVCVWANELRVADFDREAGWAANARLNTKLADFMNITATTRYTTYGFGGIQQRISERSRSEISEYDVSANVALDKLLPEKIGLKIPMYVSYESSRIVPRFDPLDPDLPLEASILSIADPEERDRYKRMVEDRAVRRSLNFTNVRKVKTGENAVSRIFDVENLAFTYAYSDVNRSNINTESYDMKFYKGAVAYNFSPKEWSFEPFQNSEKFSSPYLKIFQDFNFSPVPENLAFRADLDRRFVRTQLRNRDLNTIGIIPQFEKFFTFNRVYNMRWNLTRGLNIDYNARANAIIDEPVGDINTQAKRDSVWNNIKNLGRMKNFDQNINANYRLPLDKIPFTDWLSADARYAVSYSWLAGSIDQVHLFGNTIQNNREQGINSKIDLVRLYNKVRFLKDVNTPSPASRPGQAPVVKDTSQVNKPDLKLLKGLARTVMSVRSLNVNYSEREGTLMPGFLPRAFLFGLDSGFNAPGLPFILGSQNTDIKSRAVENNWLAPSAAQTMPFRQSRIVDLNIRAMVEPFPDLKIQIDARKVKQGNYQEIFRYDTLPDGSIAPVSLTPSRAGSYSITFMTIKTAFVRNGPDNTSPLFENFENYRAVFKSRLDQPQEGKNFELNHQEILIPAFIAAYTGKDTENMKTNTFPSIPLPNWNVNYAGLSKVPFFSEYFASINLTHAYSSNFDVGNYTSSLLYSDDLDLRHEVERAPVAALRDEDGQLVLAPKFVIGQVVISERFAPLIGVNFRTKSRINGRIEYKTERNLALQVMSSQITELNSRDVLLDFGYTKTGLRVPFKVKGETITLDNDITFRLGVTVRDTESIQRKIDEINTVTNGNINFQLRPTINYVVNQRLSIMLYYERSVNEPRVTNSFKRSTSSFGTQVRFSLAQ
ncbi:cell surface protein SprA [soil metagenome]